MKILRMHTKFWNILRTYSLVLVLLILAVGLSWFYKAYYHDDARQKVETLRIQVWREIARTEQEQIEIEKEYMRKKLPGPAVLDVSPTHPFCIFKEGNLVYWSDNRLVPQYNQLASDQKTRLVSLKTGKFLVNKRAFKWVNDDIEIFSLISLQRRFKIENDYLQEGFNHRIIPYSNVQLGTELSRNGANIYSPDAVYLFSLELPEQVPESQRKTFFILFSVALMAFITGAVWLKNFLSKIHLHPSPFRYEIGFGLLAGYLLLLRFLMLRYSIPNALIETEFFNPRYYASSRYTPSLGDLLLNCFTALGLVTYLIRYFFRSQTCKLILQLPQRSKWMLTVGLMVVSFGLLTVHFLFIRTLSHYSQISLDITESIHFPDPRILALVTFVLNTILFFLGSYLIVRILMPFRLSWYALFLALAVAVSLYDVVAWFMGELHPEILIGGSLYLLICYYFQLSRLLVKLTYKISLYFFLTAALCAALGAWAIYEMELDKRLTDKRDFANQLLSENDPLGEYLLNGVADDVRKDEFIQSRFVGPFISKNDIIKKVKRYLGSYFDRYDVKISVFDPYGLNLKGDDYPQSYADYVVNFQRMENGKYVYGTTYDHLYFMPSMGGSVIKQYVSLITIIRQSAIIGFIVLDLQQKRVVPTNVFPGLLLDKRFVASPAARTYSYAIYDRDNLVYHEGEYNYEKYFNTKRLHSKELFESSLVTDVYQHVGVKNDNGRVVVVSALKYKYASIFSNFSFLFLILVLIVGVYVIFYILFFQTPYARSGFATRIQIYLNLAFFLPLITVSVITVSLLSANYRENLTQSYLDVAQNIATELRFRLDDLWQKGVNIDTYEPEINELARYTRSDVSIFDRDGELMLSSQRQIYDDELLSPYINRQAWHAIARQNYLSQQLSESLGNLQYNAVYVAIRDASGKDLQGILSIPFFDSKAELDQQIGTVLATILNIFTFIFLGFLLLSYFASRILTVPLNLITQKLGKTSLQEENEPLEWKSEDEIGLLVHEYNRMLRNLEESKEALGRSEKESAWREMAQQVAHEIKNPLTPMKLTLQHLQRTLSRQEPEALMRAEKSIGTLLDQVDTLSDIATSFSAFAKMPIPKDEQFDVAALLRKITELYISDPKICFEISIPEGVFVVKGDAQLMGRIFTNLILNGIQSVPEGRTPCIEVALVCPNGHVMVSVKDNGSGIPDSIRGKVFLPHFSTKTSGSGIGLAVAKRGVEHAGGQIWFETEADKGTTFYVQLSLYKKE
ncbi:sensor histidine kinase [Xanthocytophaga flava]|uniref:sensor histidine kinase n=1 Tax=Xanthocytophaga flava TaxID=3048013 RepID=UPI0028D7A872|nr:ATP-binding protein [Xanthocytophaga flavus]MDJ1470446.1 ATP-binding protein [Xanthocytophaga flavus]